MLDIKIEKIAYPDDPRRCEANVKDRECPNVRVEGKKYCPIHLAGQRVDKEELRNYHLTKWQSRVNELADNDKVKSLREEIGILRIVLEEILNRCQDSSDLLIYSSKISDHVLKIERVVTSCHRLEQSTNLLLDKTAIIHISAMMIEIIGRHIADGDLLETISKDIAKLITEYDHARSSQAVS